MPLYEYHCGWCLKSFDVHIKLEDIETTEVFCDACGQNAEKVITAHAGYNIGGSNSASTKPKNSGRFKS